MSGHTPGPWNFQRVGSPGYFIVRGPNFKALPQTDANARLIVAAPMMYKLLAALVSEWDEGGDEAMTAEEWRAYVTDRVIEARAIVATVGGGT